MNDKFMRRISLLWLVLVWALACLQAQNVQLHYDFGHLIYEELAGRPKLTTKVDMFKADKWGSTYFFIDMKYGDGEVKSAYWEISREFRFWEPPFSWHVEYNGGIKFIKDAYLTGITYTWSNPNFTKKISFTPMYKYLRGNESPNSFQLTSTWHIHFWKGKFTFKGFADFWRDKHKDMYGNSHEWVFLSKPQFWINLNRFKHIDDRFSMSVGTEWEISTNFAKMDGFKWNPTLALKWSF